MRRELATLRGGRVTVTPRARAGGAASIAAGTEVFRYVRHADVPRFAAEGWQIPC